MLKGILSGIFQLLFISALNIIVSKIFSALTNAISGGGKGFFDIKLPGFSLTGGFETSSISSLGELAVSVTSSAQNLIQAGKMAYCVGKMLTNPGMLLGTLDILANNLLAAATEIASRLASQVMGQLNQALSQITGSITGLINNALGFLGSIIDLAESIKNFVDNLLNLGVSDWELFMSDEECEYMFATMAACMLNKFLGNKLQEFEQKISGKITEAGDKLNSAISSNLADVNSLSSYIEREKFMMEKATKQINGVSNLIS
jgi:hypothetical protein